MINNVLSDTLLGQPLEVEGVEGKFKLILIVAHDTNIASLMKAAGFPMDSGVPFGAEIQIELIEIDGMPHVIW
jgi:hypothetical protein